MKHFEQDASERFFKIRLKPGPRPDGKALLCLRRWDDLGSPALHPIVRVRVKVKVDPDAASLRLLTDEVSGSTFPLASQEQRGTQRRVSDPAEPQASGHTCRLPSPRCSLGGSVSCSDCWAPGTSRGQRTPLVQEGTLLPACEACRVQGHLCCRHGVRGSVPGNGLPQPPHDGPRGAPHLRLWGCLTRGSHPQAQEAPSGLSVESYQGASAAGPGDWGSWCRMDCEQGGSGQATC